MTGLGTNRETAIQGALERLSLEDKVHLLSGQDMWSLPAIGAIGLQSIVMSDGPVGVRGTRWSADDPSVALPSPTALAATWDPALARAAGHLLGQEARRKCVHVLLAPTVNLHRSPLGGRHFEAYSEDPLLTAAIGTGYVRGVQDQGVAATVKHYVANDFETERFTASAEVGERALRELYLAPFEALVRDAGAWAVMSAYNAVNGVAMTTNGALQLGVLSDEWGFDGVVVSDWMAAHDTAGTANGGLDVVMPARGSPWGSRLVAAVRDGAVRPGVIDEHVTRVLRLAARVGALAGVAEDVPPERRPAPVDGQPLAREIAVRSFVLAANRDDALPLHPPSLRRIAVIGALAKHARVLGGGSATVFPRPCHLAARGLLSRAACPGGTQLRDRHRPEGAPRARRWPGLDGPEGGLQGRLGRGSARHRARHRLRPLDGVARRRRARRASERRDLRTADRRHRRASPAEHPRDRLVHAHGWRLGVVRRRRVPGQHGFLQVVPRAA
jgi:beta-glucosidase